MTLKATVDYGPVKAGKEYRVVGEGCDWYAVKVRGTVLHVFRWVFA
jgi:hypothetical protein